MTGNKSATGGSVTCGYAEVGGARLYFEAAGAGHPLVLVHAGIADCRMWDEQFHTLARHYRVIRYDRRGFGETEADGRPYSHHQDLHDLLEFLGVERAHLAGCSQGAKAVLDFTLEHPRRAASLVLAAPSVSGFAFAEQDSPRRRELERACEAGDIERANELELQIWVDGPRRAPERVNPEVRERVRAMNRTALVKSEGAGVELQLEPAAADRLGEIRAPALVVVGDLDTPKTLAAADFLTRHLAGARKAVVRGAAHLPNMERPEEFGRHVLSFLAGLG